MPPPREGAKCHLCVRNKLLPVSQEGHGPILLGGSARSLVRLPKSGLSLPVGACAVVLDLESTRIQPHTRLSTRSRACRDFEISLRAWPATPTCTSRSRLRRGGKC